MTTELREDKQRDWKSIVSAALFLGGLLLALLITALSTWTDLEAAMFNPSLPEFIAGDALRSLRCPLFITPDDEATISATFSNPLERPVRYLVQANIAQRYVTLMRQTETEVELDVGEQQMLTWPISADQAVFNRVVLARVYFRRVPQVEGQQGACGVLVLPFSGLSGNQYAVILVALSLIGIGVGGGWWWWQKRPLIGRNREWGRAFGILGVLVLAGFILSMVGFWGVTIGILILIVLYLGAMIEHFYSSRLKPPF